MSADLEVSTPTTETTAAATLDRLKATISGQLSPYVDRAGEFALLDFPNHPNVGDSAIWLGELAYFASAHGSRPAFVCSKDNWDPDALRRVVPDGTIFLSGGGNFGDLWPGEQAFRELVLEQFPNRPIVQLPQTIHFNDPEGHRRIARAISAHGKFVLFVRDHRSFEMATRLYQCPVHLAPDMAFCMGTKSRTVAATHKLVMLLRTDKESDRTASAKPERMPAGAIVSDWLDEDPALFGKQKRRSALLSVFALGSDAFRKPKQRELLFRNLATDRVNRGMNILSSGSSVITDRLHGHIMCMLLGIPHIVFDNSYQKLGTFLDAWTRDCGLVQVAHSLEHAIELWQRSHADRD